MSATRTPRTRLLLATAGCLVGAALAWYAATRTWSTQLVDRPAPLEPQVVAQPGVTLVPWLSAAAVVSLAGAGALLATRLLARTLVGLLLVLSGASILVGAGYGFFPAVGIGRVWSICCLLGGVAVIGAGGSALRHGRSWPAMGTRYERPSPTAPELDRGASSSPTAWWDALDRGDDPTSREPVAGR